MCIRDSGNANTGFVVLKIQADMIVGTETSVFWVDLTKLGITALSEADSIRCYSDSRKENEIPRDIQSPKVMFARMVDATVGSLLFIDWDNSRSDYNATDTYGRNNVWQDEHHRYALNEETTSTCLDSTGDNNGSYQNTLPTRVNFG